VRRESVTRRPVVCCARKALRDATAAVHVLSAEYEEVDSAWLHALAKASFLQARQPTVCCAALILRLPRGPASSLSCDATGYATVGQGSCALRLGNARAACSYLHKAVTLAPGDALVIKLLQTAVCDCLCALPELICVQPPFSAPTPGVRALWFITGTPGPSAAQHRNCCASGARAA
jgi:hypothetical protein